MSDITQGAKQIRKLVGNYIFFFCVHLNFYQKRLRCKLEREVTFEMAVLLRCPITFMLITSQRESGSCRLHLCSGDFCETSAIMEKSSSLNQVLGFVWEMTNNFY